MDNAESKTPVSLTARRARAMLALRAERSFGLTAVRKPSRPISRTIETIPAAPAQSPIAQVKAPAVVTADAIIHVPLVVVDMITAPELSPSEKAARLAEMDEREVKGCVQCDLCKTRTNTVFADGDPNARLMFIGEGPGENEDLQGRPFVGRAGQLLDKQIGAMGLTRQQVYIANIVKCRPPGNRKPAPDEARTCMPYLERQIEIVRPRVIVTLGLTPSQNLLQVKTSMGRMRGIWSSYRGIRVMPTFHPAYILRSYTREVREAVWSDLQKVMLELGLSAPKNSS